MKTSKPLYTFMFVLLASLTVGLLPVASVRAVTYNVPSGQTTLNFSPQFFNLIPALGAEVTRIKPAKLKGNLNKQNLRAIFPITTGALDASGNKAQFIHEGGLTLATGNTTVQLTAFAIDFDLFFDGDAIGTDNRANRIITALIIANGNLLGRLPVFNIDVDSVTSSVSGSTIRFDNVAVTMTQVTATALNEIFNLPGEGGAAFFEGFPVGTLNLRANNVQDLANP
jgi:hypothetical protein